MRYTLDLCFSSETEVNKEIKTKQIFKETFLGKSCIENVRFKRNSFDLKQIKNTCSIYYSGEVDTSIHSPEEIHKDISTTFNNIPAIREKLLLFRTIWDTKKSNNWPQIYSTVLS